MCPVYLLCFAAANTSVHFVSRGDGTYNVTLVSLPGRTLVLMIVDGRARLRTAVNGKECYLNRVYVETKVPTMRMHTPHTPDLTHSPALASTYACVI